MNRLMCMRIITRTGAGLALLLLTTACRDITAPELARLVIEAEQVAAHAGEAQPYWKLLRQLQVGPWSYAVGALAVDLGGEVRTFSAIVIERTVVRESADDGFPCPVVHRYVNAAQDSARSLHFGGADFSKPVTRREDCWHWFQFPQANAIAPSAPYVHLFEPRRYGEGISGSARISMLAGGSIPCPFVAHPGFPTAAPPPDATCELAEFEVEMDAVLEVGSHSGNEYLGAGTLRVGVPRQRLPGIRVTMHCGRNNTIPGCPL